MPTLIIDNRTVTVPEKANVLEAAKRLGIVIPHFCYHEALGAVGACRLCAMMFLDGPVKGLQMSCMVEAKDGMVVSTLDENARDLRKHVIEWLMLNHPHDCPVCDEGGECQLQDMTVAGGHGIRRFRGLKRAYHNQFLGPFIEHEMNRCIQCFRCVRTYQDYCGGTDFGVMGSRDRLYFGRFRDGRLESPFSGNLVDVCPTGVFTDKTFRYRSRYWDLEEASSVCPHCSLGCATIPGARYRELQRVRAGVSRQTNGFFICDRGRFGYGHANHSDRPRVPQADGREVSWPEALTETRMRLRSLVERHGPQSVAFLGSPRASLEANFMLRQLAAKFGSKQIAFECHPGRDRTARTVAARLGERARSLEEIRQSDFVLLAGADPVAEGPMAALAVRQAVRGGAQAAVLDPRPVELPCEAAHLPLLPERLVEALEALVREDFSAFSRHEAIFLEGLSARLRQAKRPVLVGGADLLGPAGVETFLAAAEKLSSGERPCGAMILLAGPNSFGAGLLAGEGSAFDALLDRVHGGEIKALVCLEADPLADFPDPGLAQEAFSRLEFLAVLDCLPTLTARRADLLLPTTAPAEGGGTLINNEGRLRTCQTVFDPGLPIRVTGGGDHPPRIFEAAAPGSLPRPAWAVTAALAQRPLSLARVRRELAATEPRLANLPDLAPEEEGKRVESPGALAMPPASAPLDCRPPDTLRLLAVETLFGSEVFSHFSNPLETVLPDPFALLHALEAARLGIAEGEDIVLITRHGRVEVSARLSDRMAPGLVILPRLRGTPLADFVPGGEMLFCRVEKGGRA